MDISRRSTLVYGLLLAAWVIVVAWQVEEHYRVKQSARAGVRNRANEIANSLSAVITALRFRGGPVIQDRLEPVLNELVAGRTNESNSSELIGIVLLNRADQPVVAAGEPIDLAQPDLMLEGERWGRETVTFLDSIRGASLGSDGNTNAPFVIPTRQDMTNTFRGSGGERERERTNRESDHSGESREERERRERERRERERRPRWARGMNLTQEEFEALLERRELHGLALTMSTANLHSVITRDFWQRCIVAFFAGISALGVGLAWRNVARSADLQIRLVRASELNSHLREMNLAAAGLAHETRNPLNIIRGQAQMISRQTDAPAEIREKSRAIVDETDKVTAQLNEFINYSRPREVRRVPLALVPAVNEVVRALGYDLEEKNVRVEVKGDPLTIEADEQLFRQALFNLLLNAVQAVEPGGEIRVLTERKGAAGILEVRDNGPGVPPDRRKEIFKPYFTTHQKGTGLGLAVVQQIVLAHGWEIECLGNEPKGAVFRVTHLKVVG